MLGGVLAVLAGILRELAGILRELAGIWRKRSIKNPPKRVKASAKKLNRLFLYAALGLVRGFANYPQLDKLCRKRRILALLD